MTSGPRERCDVFAAAVVMKVAVLALLQSSRLAGATVRFLFTDRPEMVALSVRLYPSTHDPFLFDLEIKSSHWAIREASRSIERVNELVIAAHRGSLQAISCNILRKIV